MKATTQTYQNDRQVLHEILPLGTPLALEFHPTHKCNFRCNYCIQHSGKGTAGGKPFARDEMPWDLFELMADQCKDFPDKIKIVSIAGMGEPLLHPRIVDMVRRFADSKVFKKTQIITNASMLTRELSERLVGAGLGNLKVSLQGVNAETYARIANAKVDWNKIYDNIRYFSSIKGHCSLVVKIADTALEPNEESKFYDLFGAICDGAGIEHIFDSWRPNGVIIGSANIKPAYKTIWGYEPREILICRQRFTTFDILPDGTFCLGGCHRRYGFESNIRDVPVAEQWSCREANAVRAALLCGHRQSDPLCRICEYGQQNWHPSDLLEGHEEEILARMYERGMLGE
jgi:sulfatase maturation enzyme AslB (radical SAM superfamily)